MGIFGWQVLCWYVLLHPFQSTHHHSLENRRTNKLAKGWNLREARVFESFPVSTVISSREEL